LSDFPSVDGELTPEKPILLYLPVFSKRTSQEYLEKLRNFYDSSKLSSIVKMGLIKDSENSESYLRLFPEVKFMRMYIIDSDNGFEVGDNDLWVKENFNHLLLKIVDLCSELERELKSQNKTIPSQETKAVYLAETTPDLISVREEIRRELLRQGFEVYPKKVISGNAKDIEKGIIDLLHKSVLSIHLFGKLYQEPRQGESPRAELENKLAAQYYLNKKESKKNNQLPFRRIIWFPDNLVVSNEKQIKILEDLQKDKKLYAGSDIIKSSVEELKDIIFEKLTEKLQKMAGIMLVQNKLSLIKDCLRTE
jgi:hypothetical protein